MSRDVIRAWKDRRYRRGLTTEQAAGVPAHPAGAVALHDERLALLGGGTLTVVPISMRSDCITMPYPMGTCTGGTLCYPCDPMLALDATA